MTETNAADEALKKIIEDPERKKAAHEVALLAVDRFNNLHGSKFGAPLVEQFSSYIIEQATDVDAAVLKKHATNLTAMKLIDPDAWSRRKPWLAAPKGHRLLKSLMKIIREGDKRYVWRVNDGKAERIAIRAGAERGGEPEVLAGVSSGDMLIAEPSPQLVSGASVEIKQD